MYKLCQTAWLLQNNLVYPRSLVFTTSNDYIIFTLYFLTVKQFWIAVSNEPGFCCLTSNSFDCATPRWLLALTTLSLAENLWPGFPTAKNINSWMNSNYEQAGSLLAQSALTKMENQSTVRLVKVYTSLVFCYLPLSTKQRCVLLHSSPTMESKRPSR